MNTIVKERKLGFFDIIKEGLKIFFFKFKDIALMVLGFILPYYIVYRYFYPSMMAGGAEVDAGMLLLLTFLLLLQLLIGIILQMSIAVIVEGVVNRRDISAAAALRHALSRFGGAVTASFLTFIVVFALLLLLIVPGIVYSTYYTFVLFAVALRNKSGTAALDYSKNLVTGQWWRVFGVLFGLGFILGVFHWFVTLPLIRISDNPIYAIVLNSVIYLIGCIFTVMIVVLFLNMDFVTRRRSVKRAELARSRKTKPAPSFEEFAQKVVNDKKRSSRPSTSRGAARTPAKKAGSVKKSSRAKK
jgi:hypothetical protein